MNFKTTLILLVLVALAAVYFLAFERGNAPAETPRQAAGPAAEGDPLLPPGSLSAADVRRIVIEPADGERVVLVRDGQSWVQTAPVQFGLDPAKVQELIAAAGRLRSYRTFEPGDEAGLSPPQAVVRFETAEGERAFELGEQTLGGRAYLSLAGEEQVHLVGGTLHQAVVTGSPRSWRVRKLDAPEAGRVQRVALKRSEEQVELTRTGSDWQFTGSTGRVSRSAVERLIAAIEQVKIATFVTDDADNLAPLGLASPWLELTLEAARPGAEPERRTLRVGSPTDLEERLYYATWSRGDEPSTVVFAVRAETVQAVDRGQDALRAPHMTSFEPGDLGRIDIARPGSEPIALARTESGGWTFAEPGPDYEPDREAMGRLIEAIRAEAVDYRPADPLTGEPTATLTLADRVNASRETIRIYPDEAGGFYLARREDEPVAYQLARGQVAPLLEPRLSLRDRTLVRIDPAHVTSIRLTVPEREASYEIEREDGGWRLAGGELEQPALEALLGQLRPLRVREWLAEAPQLDQSAELAIERDTGEPVRLEVDLASGRATMAGVDAGFRLPDAATEAIAAEFRDRLVLSLDAAAIESVAIEDGPAVRRTPAGRFVSTSGRPIDTAAAAKLYERLGGLTAEHYLPGPIGGADEPVRRMTIELADGEQATLELYAGGTAALRRGGEAQWFTLGRGAAKDLLADVAQGE
ncbi:MAG: DUF4340 domain-containing protein [Phycisphaeraceae bacterium]